MVRPLRHKAPRSTGTVRDGHISGAHLMHAAIAAKLCFGSVRAAITLDSAIGAAREARIVGDVWSGASSIRGKAPTVGGVDVLSRHIRSHITGAAIGIVIPATIPRGLIVGI